MCLYIENTYNPVIYKTKQNNNGDCILILYCLIYEGLVPPCGKNAAITQISNDFIPNFFIQSMVVSEKDNRYNSFDF